MIPATEQVGFQRLNQATVLQSAPTTTHFLDYGATWASTAEPHAAQNPDKWPTNKDITTAGGIIPSLPTNVNFIDLIFAVADAAGEKVAGILWARDGHGPAMALFEANPIVAGTSPVEVDPHTGVALTNFFYADAITLTEQNCDVEVFDDTDNGIAMIRLDMNGKNEMLFSAKINDVSSTDGTDVIVWYKYH